MNTDTIPQNTHTSQKSAMKLVGNSPIPPHEIREILESPIPFTNDEEREMAEDMIESLSEEELEIAAQSSYAYWLATLSEQLPTAKDRYRMALREARRHIYDEEYNMAVASLKETCKFRKGQRIGLLRSCFMEQAAINHDSEQEEAEAQRLRKLVEDDLTRQACYVRGRDREGRALLVIRSRHEKGTNDEDFVATQLYMMERAIASTEYETKGNYEKIVVVLDFGSFQSSKAPSFKAVKAFAVTMQHRYPNRLKHMVIIDPPLWMRTMYSLLKAFLDSTTRAKFILATGTKQKERALRKLIDCKQAMPFMMPGAGLTESVDIGRALRIVPFHHCYDDILVTAY